MLFATLMGLLTVTAVAACAAAAPSDRGAGLDGSSWVLAEVLTDSGPEVTTTSNASLTFEPDGRLAGSTGCNRFTGQWQTDGDRLRIELGGVTRRGCPGALAEREQAVLAALAATTHFRVTETGLALLDSTGTAQARYRSAVRELAGSRWQVVAVNNGHGGVESSSATADLSLTFGTDATVTGFDGCGRLGGTYAVTGNRVTIEPTAASGCGAELQATYLAALGQAAVWQVDGPTLNLRDASGSLQVRLVQAV